MTKNNCIEKRFSGPACKNQLINVEVYEDMVFIENKYNEDIEKKDIEDMIESRELKKVLFEDYESAVEELINCGFVVVNILGGGFNGLFVLEAK